MDFDPVFKRHRFILNFCIFVSIFNMFEFAGMFGFHKPLKGILIFQYILGGLTVGIFLLVRHLFPHHPIKTDLFFSTRKVLFLARHLCQINLLFPENVVAGQFGFFILRILRGHQQRLSRHLTYFFFYVIIIFIINSLTRLSLNLVFLNKFGNFILLEHFDQFFFAAIFF